MGRGLHLDDSSGRRVLHIPDAKIEVDDDSVRGVHDLNPPAAHGEADRAPVLQSLVGDMQWSAFQLVDMVHRHVLVRASRRTVLVADIVILSMRCPVWSQARCIPKQSRSVTEVGLPTAAFYNEEGSFRVVLRVSCSSEKGFSVVSLVAALA